MIPLKNNSSSELEQLKSLLLSTELSQLKLLESKLEMLRESSYTEETVVTKVTELFNTILMKRFANEAGETIEIFSTHIAKIIKQAYKNNPQELTGVLQETVAESIKQEIANNKDVMIDSLYPIMGGMISKYVTQALKEMMDNINLKLEEGLSLNNYKRKAKAKMTGVSESELLMQESQSTLLSSLFVIKKESGLLIAQAQLGEKEIDDPHMVASMASAIKDFINDWVKNNVSKSEVQIVSYGNATLYIESAGSVYVIAFLDGEPNASLRLEINKFFASLIGEYALFFQDFKGDDSALEIPKISTKMLNFLDKQKRHTNATQPQKRVNITKVFLYFIGLIGLGAILYHLFLTYIEYDLERVVEEKTGQKITIEASYDRLKTEGFVESFDAFSRVENILKQESQREIENHILVLSKKLFGSLHLETKERKAEDNRTNHQTRIQLKELQKSMRTLQEKLSQIERERVKTKYKAEVEIKLLKQAREIEIKEIEKALDEVFGENLFYEKSTQSLNFATLPLFAVGTSQYSLKAIKTVETNILKYLEVLYSHRESIASITIEGHSDSEGDEALNQRLSKQRALNVREYLWNLDSSQTFYMQSFLKIAFFGSEQRVIEEGIENKVASRRITIKFTLKEDKIANIIKKIMND